MNLGRDNIQPTLSSIFHLPSALSPKQQLMPKLGHSPFFFFFYFLSVPFCFQRSQTLSHFLMPIGQQSWGQEHGGLDIRFKTSVFGRYPWLTCKPNVLHTHIHVSLEHSCVLLENLPLSCICEPMGPWKAPTSEVLPIWCAPEARWEGCLWSLPFTIAPCALIPSTFKTLHIFWDSDFALDLCSYLAHIFNSY